MFQDNGCEIRKGSETMVVVGRIDEFFYQLKGANGQRFMT